MDVKRQMVCPIIDDRDGQSQFSILFLFQLPWCEKSDPIHIDRNCLDRQWKFVDRN